MSKKFLQFKVYNDAKNLHRQIVFQTKDYSREYSYLKDQIRRSSLSIVLSIAEGSAKISHKDFARYLQIAMGSASEALAALDVSHDIALIEDEVFAGLSDLCISINNQLGGFTKKLLQ